jgi:hypothetical protein
MRCVESWPCARRFEWPILYKRIISLGERLCNFVWATRIIFLWPVFIMLWASFNAICNWFRRGFGVFLTASLVGGPEFVWATFFTWWATFEISIGDLVESSLKSFPGLYYIHLGHVRKVLRCQNSFLWMKVERRPRFVWATFFTWWATFQFCIGDRHNSFIKMLFKLWTSFPC